MAERNGHKPLGPDYWLTYLSTAIADALTLPVDLARAELRDALQRFTRSRECDTYLRDLIQTMRGDRNA